MSIKFDRDYQLQEKISILIFIQNHLTCFTVLPPKSQLTEEDTKQGCQRNVAKTKGPLLNSMKPKP
jgi:hypothetical protein